MERRCDVERVPKCTTLATLFSESDEDGVDEVGARMQSFWFQGSGGH